MSRKSFDPRDVDDDEIDTGLDVTDEGVPSKAVASPTGDPPGVVALKRLLAMESIMDTGSIMVARQDVVMRAETLEDVLAEGEKGPAKKEDIVGRPMRFLDVKFRQSAPQFRAEGGLGYHCAVLAVNPITGVEYAVMVGGEFLTAQFMRISQLGAFPFVAVMFTETTSAGREVVKLRPLTLEERRMVETIESATRD